MSASGATSIKIADLDTKELSVIGSGAMKIELAGRANVQKVGISGAGVIACAHAASRPIS